jgi:hypothetical protein
MIAHTFEMDTQQNVGTVDRILRFAIGSALIAFPMLYQGTATEYAALTALASIPVIVTAIICWDPVYGLLKFSSMTTDDTKRFRQRYGNVQRDISKSSKARHVHIDHSGRKAA